MRRLLASLSRRTTSGRFIPEIDGLRFIAILLVIGGHLRYFLDKQGGGTYAGTLDSNLLARVLGRGDIGVQLFFSISGFILALPFASAALHARPSPALRPYFLRRVTRLEPPYILALAIFFALRVVFQHASARELFPHLVASWFYVHNILFGAGSLVLAVAWSLEIEIQFYILVPLLARVFSIRTTAIRRAVIGGAMLGMALLRAFVFAKHGTLPELTIAGHLQYFLAGFLVADLYLATWGEAPTTSIFGDVAAFGGLAMMMLQWPSSFEASMTVFPFLILAVGYGAFRGYAFRVFVRNPYISTIGGMCYSIYLLHFPVITSLGLAVRHWVVVGDSFALDLVRFAAVALPVVLIISTVYFVVIERPCMDRDWPQRLWRFVRRA